MKLDVTVKHGDKKSYKPTKKTLKRLVQQHLEPHLQAFNPNHMRLHASVEKIKKDYQVLLHLNVPPRKVLVAKETAENLQTAIEAAIKDLSRQAEKHAAKIRGREQWKRKQRRQRIKQYEAKLASQLPEIKDDVKKSIEPLISRLEKYIKQELTFLQANGDLPSNYPTVEDVRDEALLQVQLKWDALENWDEDLYQALIKAVNEVLTEEVIQNQLHENDISLEAEPAKDAKEQAEAMVEEEISEFYQPFERLHIEDLIPDNGEPLPDELVDQNVREVGYQTLASLPSQWRRLVVLNHQEQIPLEKIAKKIMPQPLSELQNLLNSAEQFMLATLHERGFTSIDKSLLDKLFR